MFNNLQAKRIFPLITAGGSFAGILVGSSMSLVVQKFDLYSLITMTAFLILIIVFYLPVIV